MKKLFDVCERERIGENFCPQICDDYIIFYGDKLFVFTLDGSLVIARKDLRNISKVHLIDKDLILVACGAADAYIAISLQNGCECWRIPYPKCDMLSRCFVRSHDGLHLYDYYDWRGKYYFAQIDLEHKDIKIFRLQNGLRCICDIICDDDGFPCLLESHYEQVAEKDISINGVRYIYRDEFDPGSDFFWKYKWEMPHPRIAKCFLDNAHTVLTNDLYVYDLKEGICYYLLENEEHWEDPALPVSYCWTDSKNHYIVLVYDDVNIVVDRNRRKMVARYKAVFKSGCFVGDEYWVCSENGLLKNAFPMIEDMPPRKPVFF